MGGKGARARYQARYRQRLLQGWIEEHPEETTRLRGLAEEVLVEEDRCRQLALWVRTWRHEHDGQGPTWKQIALHARPDLEKAAPGDFQMRVFIQHLLQGLHAQRWLRSDSKPNSTRQGPRLYEEGTLPDDRSDKAVPAPRNTPDPAAEPAPVSLSS